MFSSSTYAPIIIVFIPVVNNYFETGIFYVFGIWNTANHLSSMQGLDIRCTLDKCKVYVPRRLSYIMFI